MKKLWIVLLLVSLQAFSVDRQKVYLDVKGMTCAFCAYGLEKNLKKISGVEYVRVSLKQKKVILVLQPNQKVDQSFVDNIKKTVVDAGYTHANLTVKGE